MSRLLFSRRQILSTLSMLSLGSLTKGFASPVSPPKKATFVLVHGAWHGGWCWKKVIPLLKAAGHNVYTPTLTGLGERSHLLNQQVDLNTHIQDIAAVLEYEDLHDVILVGHSYAGAVITGVADKVSKRIGQVVYLDAFLPENGKSIRDYADKEGQEWMDQLVQTKGDGWRFPCPLAVSKDFLGVTDPIDLAWMAPRIGDQPYKTLTQPLQLTFVNSDKSFKRTYVQLTEEFAEHAGRAKSEGFRFFQMLTGGHDAMVTKPKELVQIFNELV